jgi:hypothetical protein
VLFLKYKCNGFEVEGRVVVSDSDSYSVLVMAGGESAWNVTGTVM